MRARYLPGVRWPGWLYVLPVGATFLGAYLLLGPARLRPAVAARLLAAESSDGQVRSLRVVTLARLDRLEEPRAMKDLRLYEGDRLVASAESDEAGVAELVFDSPLDASKQLRLVAGEQLLAEGRLTVPSARRPDEQPARALAGRQEGELRVEVALSRGALLPPFREALELRVRTAEGQPVEGVRARVTAVGASPEEQTLELPRGEGRFEIVPEAQRVELEVRAELTRPGQAPSEPAPSGEAAGEAQPAPTRGSYAGTLPEVLGGVWLDPSGLPEKARLVAPSPRRVTLVSLHDALGRRGGAVVPLHEDPDGFFRGELPLPSCAAPPCSLVASSDALELGQSTVVWPTSPTEGLPRAGSLALALDGMPGAIALERTRVKRIRVGAITGLSLSAAIEVFLLLRARRDSERALGEQLGAALARDAARTQRRMVAIAAALVALVFAALIAVSLR